MASQLEKFINKPLRITTTDERLFCGALKCTDKDKNLILAGTTEYRYPEKHEEKKEADLESRYIGLVVIPGDVITKIEMAQGWLPGAGGII